MKKGVYSERLELAIQKATLLHKEQKRLTPDELPYISHLFSVFVILSSYTDDEDTLIAGILHDAVEDTHYTFEELEKDFGGEVCKLVRGVTEQKERKGRKLPWKVRKLSYLENLKSDCEKSMLICVADKIYNLEALSRDFLLYGENVWKMLRPGAEAKLWYHEEVISILEKRLTHKKALKDLRRTYKRTRAVLLGLEDEEIQAREIHPFKRYIAVSSRIPEYAFGALKTLRSRVQSVRIFGYGNRNTG